MKEGKARVCTVDQSFQLMSFQFFLFECVASNEMRHIRLPIIHLSPMNSNNFVVATNVILSSKRKEKGKESCALYLQETLILSLITWFLSRYITSDDVFRTVFLNHVLSDRNPLFQKAILWLLAYSSATFSITRSGPAPRSVQIWLELLN